MLPGSSRVEVRANARGGAVRLTLDGQTGFGLAEGDHVVVARSPHPVQLVRLSLPPPLRDPAREAGLGHAVIERLSIRDLAVVDGRSSSSARV